MWALKMIAEIILAYDNTLFYKKPLYKKLRYTTLMEENVAGTRSRGKKILASISSQIRDFKSDGQMLGASYNHHQPQLNVS